MSVTANKGLGLLASLAVLIAAPFFNGICGEANMYSQFEKLTGDLQWINVSRPIGGADMKGRVVLLDFWTYCCINCIHVIPDIKRLEAKYGDDLLVIGVHCGKFKAEKDSENIRQAVLRYGLSHPVVNDAKFQVWSAFESHSWPTLALVDSSGFYQGSVSGEGNYETLDKSIALLLSKRKEKPSSKLLMALEAAKAESLGLSFPGKIIASKDGRIFVADSGHNRIVATNASGELLAVIGSGAPGSSDGAFEEASFFNPQGLALAGDMLYIADTDNHLLRAANLKDRSVSSVAGTGVQGHVRSGSGPSLKTPMNSPWDLAVLPDGKLLIAMAGSHQLWAFDPKSSVLSHFSGDGHEGIADGSSSSSSFAQPSGLALSSDASALYVADSEVSAIRAVSASSGEARTLVGTGLFDFGDRDGIGDAARLQHPLGVAFHEGLVYVVDTYNGKLKTVNPATRELKTLATPGLKLHEPGGLCVLDGFAYVADSNAHRIAKIDLKTGEPSPFAVKGLLPPSKGGDELKACPLPPQGNK